MNQYVKVTFTFVLLSLAVVSLLFNNNVSASRNLALPGGTLHAMQISSGNNVALASNGAIATASSTHVSGNYPVAAVNNGDRRATNWGAGGGWNDSTQGDTSSDIVQINFPGTNFLSTINVFTLRNNFQDNQTPPTLSETFNTCENSGFGITEFEVQYWNGSMWITVPGGIVRENNKVWRQFVFPEVTASAIRVQVHGAVRFTNTNYSRIVEIEAFGRTELNIAAASNAAVATATSTLNASYPVSAVNDGDRTGFNWGRGGFGSGWNDATENEYSIDWVRIDFNGGQPRRINEVDVYTLRDAFATGRSDPAITETFATDDNTGQGITDYDVQYLSGGVWRMIPGGKVTGNNKVWRQFRFSPITTNAIRVAVNKGANFTKFANNWSRIVEIEAWENTTVPDDTLWVGDALPTGAVPLGAWNWTCFDPLPLSGTLAHKSNIAAGENQHYFHSATQTLTVNTGDTLVAHVFLDPLNPPTQVMLQWNDGTWDHRAYWGQSQLPWGVEGTASLRSMGALPPTGQWVRLEVPANLVGLEGRTLNGMAFTLFNGRATWDHAGKIASTAPPPPAISISDATVTEGNSGLTSATFNVTLSSTSSQNVSVNYATASNTAVSGSDFFTASGTLTFTPGQLSKPVTVQVIGDTVVEPDEFFFVALSSPVNATISDPNGVGTILNDDTVPTVSISISDAAVIEGSCGGTPKAVFNVNLSGTSSQNVSVSYVTSNGTAFSPGDYTAASGSVTIPAGQTSRPVEIFAKSDISVESDETFFVTLSNPVNGNILDGQGQAVIKNDDATPPAATNPGEKGQWGPCEELETVPVHVNLLPNGKLLYWGRDKHPDTWDTAGSSNTYVWDPITKVRSGPILNPTSNLFCSAHSFLPDGRLLVAGGHNRYDLVPDQEGIGETDINTFNYLSNSWTLTPSQMQQGRWYPSSLVMANGDTAIFAGTYWTGGFENGRPKTERNSFANIYTAQNNLLLSTAEFPMRNYPYLHLMGDGRVFGLTGGLDWFFNPAVDQFEDVSFATQPGFDHFEGTSVLYNTEAGKVMVIGGRTGMNGVSLKQTDIFDISSQNWSAGPSMTYKRQYHNTTLLPDGKILATGGQRCDGATPNFDCTDGAANIPEIWSPSTNAWAELAENPTRTPRIYHSVALLLPDARVLIGGGGLPAAKGDKVVDTATNTVITCSGNPPQDPVICRHFGHKDVEIFSPPYLFQANGQPAARPTINSAPAQITLGDTFNVSISSSVAVNSASLIRLPTVTHGLNFDQRRVVLNVQSPSTTNLTLTVANDSAQVPPGYYMLFVMNSNGVPSIAKFVKVNRPVPPTYPLPEVGSRVTRNLDGRLQLFYKGSDNGILYSVQNAPSSDSWSSHVYLGGVKTSNPVAIPNADGRLEVFAKGTDNAIYHRWQLSPGSFVWSNWVSLGGSGSGDPALARNSDGRLQLFYRGGDNLLYTAAQVSPGSNTWTTHTNLFGTLISDPAVAINVGGRLEVFAVMTDNGLHHIWQNSAGSNSWSGWFSLGGFTNSTSLAAARNSDGNLQVFYRDAGTNSLFFTKQSPGSPGGWTPAHTNLGGALTSDPSVGINADGRLEIFVRGTDNGLHHIWQTAPSSNTWSPWSPLGGNLASGLVAPATNANGRLSVVVRWFDTSLSYNVQTGIPSMPWSGFITLEGGATSF